MRTRRIYDDPPSVRRRNLFNWNSTGQMTLNPLTLFLNGEQGVWYDPSDFSTMFQDSAGTTPVTAVEQPVGLLLDKSKGLTLGPELVTNGDFSDGTTGWSVTQNDGTIAVVAGELEFTYGTAIPSFSRSVSCVVGKSYKVSAVIRQGTTAAQVDVRVSPNGTLNASITILPATTTTPTTVSAVFVATAATMYVGGRVAGAGTALYDNITIKELPGNHASQATSTKRPLLRQDGNGKYYLYFDGVDDFLVTNAVDFTATDKMTVFAGVRKVVNGSFPVFAELGAYNANLGSFTLGGNNGNGYVWGSKGTVAANVIVTTGFPAPITNVLTGIGSISTDVAVLRANGVQIGALATDQGTGNYGNLALYIGARTGASLFVNGHIYSLIVRGAQSTATQLVSAETYVNSKTGAY